MSEETFDVNLFNLLMGDNAIDCKICNELLTTPVMLVEGIGDICNPCYTSEENAKHNWKGIPNTSLEAVLNAIKIPCGHRVIGCTLIMKYKDLKQHLKVCKFSQKPCPIGMDENCSWQGITANFMEHFKDKHNESILQSNKNVFEITVQVLAETNDIWLLVTPTYVFKLQINFSEDFSTMKYMLSNTLNNDPVVYTVEFKGKSGKSTIIFNGIKTVPADNMLDKNNPPKPEQLKLTSFKDLTNFQDEITCIIKLGLPDVVQLDDKLLNLLECPVCKNLMRPPIILCQSGHSVCSCCRPKLDRCPTCRTNFGAARNYALEGLTAQVHYACSYHDAGCTEKLPCDAILTHEKSCLFKPCKCPFSNCTLVGGFEKVREHLLGFHKTPQVNHVKSSLSLNRGLYVTLDRKMHCILAFDHIFRVTSKSIVDAGFWAVEIIGRKKSDKDFKFEVHVEDTQHNLKMMREDYCSMETNDEQELQRKGMSTSHILLSAYSHNSLISYTIKIVEIPARNN